MNVLILEPYLTKSHEKWMKSLERHLPFQVRSLTLPPRYWKWRMHGASITLAQAFLRMNWQPDCIIMSEMMDVGIFLAQTRLKLGQIPVILYFHENQLTYPMSAKDRDRERRFDNHYPFINYTSALVANHVLFNSHFHRDEFLSNLGPFLRKYPDHSKDLPVEILWEKSSVMYPGIDLDPMENVRVQKVPGPPVILWNHRWEYDKNPKLFFQTLFELKARNIPFRLCVLGQSFAEQPEIFSVAERILKNEIVCFGFEVDDDAYYKWLWRSDIVVSTSNQDFFGISVVEAMYCHCFPLLPNRLAYPEHIPNDLHPSCLYDSEEDLLDQLIWVMDHLDALQEKMEMIRNRVASYDVRNCVESYVPILKGLVEGNT
ncbi:MAG: DUF3524 domain-containing protein [Saprospiraceae bacterium]|nr:DUF3524 domain-containing protein [Saprospiraceae bacterium]